jgi:2-dehydro-3-deoxyphosphogluconate aldolase / (4S)-4-hydroxy-2-oxoglutarate aldolase
MIKLFPGDLLGPGFMSSIKSLFPDLLFMPTGGVSLDKENLEGWFKAGVCAVGMGSKLVSKQLLEEKNYEKIGELTKKVMETINGLRE